MTGQDLINTIKQHHLEQYHMSEGHIDDGYGIDISFLVNDTTLPYPEYRDALFDEPAHIYVSKELHIDLDGNSNCEEYTWNTSEK